MRVAEWPLAQLHWQIRKDPWVREIFLAGGGRLDELAERILALYYNWDFENMPEDALATQETLLGIRPIPGESLEERRQRARLRWLAKTRPSLETIQRVCDGWKEDQVLAEYIPGVIILWLLEGQGKPADIEALTRLLETTRPAQLALDPCYRFLLIKQVHLRRSNREMQSIPLKYFAGGRGQTDRPRDLGVRKRDGRLVVDCNARVSAAQSGGFLRLSSGSAAQLEKGARIKGKEG